MAWRPHRSARPGASAGRQPRPGLSEARSSSDPAQMRLGVEGIRSLECAGAGSGRVILLHQELRPAFSPARLFGPVPRLPRCEFDCAAPGAGSPRLDARESGRPPCEKHNAPGIREGFLPAVQSWPAQTRRPWVPSIRRAVTLNRPFFPLHANPLTKVPALKGACDAIPRNAVPSVRADPALGNDVESLDLIQLLDQALGQTICQVPRESRWRFPSLSKYSTAILCGSRPPDPVADAVGTGRCEKREIP